MGTLLFFGYFMLVTQSGFLDVVGQAMHAIMGDDLYGRAARGMNAVFNSKR